METGVGTVAAPHVEHHRTHAPADRELGGHSVGPEAVDLPLLEGLGGRHTEIHPPARRPRHGGDAHIVAPGDGATHPTPVFARRVRLESVHNAVEQANTAAATLCGNSKVYEQAPWFWSDQYDLKLQMTGLSQGYDQWVMRGSMENRSFAAFYLRDGKLIACDAVNRPQEFFIAKRMVAMCQSFDVAALSNESHPLKAFVDSPPPAQ